MPVSPDHNLASEQFPGLNRSFYRADPAGYLRQRSRSLLIAISDAPAVRTALAEGIGYKSIEYSANPNESHDREKADAYADAESTNLLHHAAECMIRLYLAHADQPPCPWLEIARLRHPGDFKAKVERLRDSLGDQDVVDSLVRTFYGDTDPAALGWNFEPAEWQQRVGGLVKLVGYLCIVLLDDATLYNATKHGLAIVPGEHDLSISAPNSDSAVSTDGIALEFLGQAREDSSGRRKWTHNMRFVGCEANLALAEVISRHVNALWSIARNRYVEPSPVEVCLIDAKTISGFINLGRAG